MKTDKITMLSIKSILKSIFIVFFIFTCPTLTTADDSNNIKTLAVLPLKVNSSQNLDYLQNGMVRMFASRLFWNNKVEVISGDQINNQINNLINNKISDNNKKSGSQFIYNLGRQTKSDYILSGSITELSGSFSIDVKIYDIVNQRYMLFSENSKIIDDVIKKTDRIAARINKKVFERATASWKRIEKEKIEHIDQLKRQNPEYLIKHRALHDREESYGWKIWKYLF